MQKIYNSILSLMLLLTLSVNINAANVESNKQDSIAGKANLFFSHDSSDAILNSDDTNFVKLIAWATQNKNGLISIEGWSNKIGNVSYNEKLATKRAETVKNFLINNNIESSRISAKGMGVDSESSYKEARKVTVLAYIPADKRYVTPAPKPAPKQEPVVKKEEPKKEVTQPAIVEKIEEPYVKVRKGREEGGFSLNTNLVYWLGGGANLGAEWRPVHTWLGIGINAGISPFQSDSWSRNLGGWFVSPEVKYYLGKSKNWHVGAQFLKAEYNIKLSESRDGYDGDMIGGGLTAGYKVKLSKVLDMGFSAGYGYGRLKYDTYNHIDGIKVIKHANRQKKGFIPLQLGINLIWNIR